ncbi:MAG: OmpA family protein [Polyangiaceae bacterium]
MNSRDERADRDAILARRALFVTTAIAALSGCASSNGDDSSHPTSTVEVSSPSATSSATATVSATSSSARGRSWPEVLAGRPPVEVSPSLPAGERSELDSLASRLANIYGELETAWGPLDCTVGDPSCDANVAKVAEVVSRYHNGIPTPHCGFFGGAGFIERFESHSEYLRAAVAELDARMTAASRAAKKPDYWPSMVAAKTPPMPCLDCALPEEPALGESSPVMILFPEGKSELAGADAVLSTARELLKNNSELYEVRGHIDDGEDASLAMARAEAVRKWLVDHGVPAAQLKAVAYGANLPIGNRTAQGRAKNRRVDLEAPGKRRK